MDAGHMPDAADARCFGALGFGLAFFCGIFVSFLTVRQRIPRHVLLRRTTARTHDQTEAAAVFATDTFPSPRGCNFARPTGRTTPFCSSGVALPSPSRS